MNKIQFEKKGDLSPAVFETINSMLVRLGDGFWTITVGKPKRTTLQNASLHLFCTWLAEGLNHHGLHQKKHSLLNDSVIIESRWTMEKVKEDIWRPLMLKETGKRSTTQMTTAECSKIADELCAAMNEAFGHLGFCARWPNREDLERERAYNLKKR